MFVSGLEKSDDVDFNFHSDFTGVRYLRFGGINKDHTILIDELSLEDNS